MGEVTVIGLENLKEQFNKKFLVQKFRVQLVDHHLLKSLLIESKYTVNLEKEDFQIKVQLLWKFLKQLKTVNK